MALTLALIAGLSLVSAMVLWPLLRGSGDVPFGSRVAWRPLPVRSGDAVRLPARSGAPPPAPSRAGPPRLLTGAQLVALLLVAAGIACGLTLSPLPTLAAVNGLLITFFAAANAMKLALIRCS